MKNILLVLVFLFAGCTSIPKIVFPEERNIEVDYISETFVSIPLEMEKIGNNIFISDFRGDSLLHCYNLSSGETKYALPLGEGPDEFLSPIQFFFQDEQMMVYNRWHYILRYCYVCLPDFMIKSINLSISVSTDVDMVYPISKDKWIASGRFADSRFIIMDKDGNELSRCGDYPSYMADEINIPNFPKFMFHQSMFGFQKEISRLTSVTGHVLELWNYYNNDSLALHKRILLSPYSYEYKDGKHWAAAKAENDVEKGVERIYCSDKYIYMLYNSNTHEMIAKKEDNLHSEIWVFDWNGTPVTKINVNREITCFCVDEDESKIYCIMNAPNPSIGYFNFEV